MSIIIKGITKEDTAWDKNITFEREGVEYRVLLHWDSYDGYDLNFLDNEHSFARFIPNPEWVNEWQDSQQYGAESLEYTLDCLTEEALEVTSL
jgi:hypothetical protein